MLNLNRIRLTGKVTREELCESIGFIDTPLIRKRIDNYTCNDTDGNKLIFDPSFNKLVEKGLNIRCKYSIVYDNNNTRWAHRVKFDDYTVTIMMQEDKPKGKQEKFVYPIDPECIAIDNENKEEEMEEEKDDKLKYEESKPSHKKYMSKCISIDQIEDEYIEVLSNMKIDDNEINIMLNNVDAEISRVETLRNDIFIVDRVHDNLNMKQTHIRMDKDNLLSQKSRITVSFSSFMDTICLIDEVKNEYLYNIRESDYVNKSVDNKNLNNLEVIYYYLISLFDVRLIEYIEYLQYVRELILNKPYIAFNRKYYNENFITCNMKKNRYGKEYKMRASDLDCGIKYWNRETNKIEYSEASYVKFVLDDKDKDEKKWKWNLMFERDDRDKLIDISKIFGIK